MSTDLGLERALTSLGGHLDYPPTPPFAEAVTARIGERDAERAAGARPRRWPLAGWSRRRLVVVAVALLLLLAALLATPAVARRVGVRGITIHLGGPAPTVTTSPAPSSSAPGSSATTLPSGGGPLGLGQRVTLAQARSAVRFPVVVPTDPALGPPDAVYVAGDVPDGRVSLVWRPRPGLPASRLTGVGLLVTEFRGQSYAGKVAGPGTQVETVTVPGATGEAFWLSGGPHILGFMDKNGDFQQDTLRLAGPTLVWQSGDLTLRLEGNVSKQTAIRIAASMR